MRRLFWCFVLALAMAAWNAAAAGAVTVLPADGCPAGAAIDLRLQRLGVLDLLGQLGTAEVRVEAALLHLHFRDRAGAALGTRTVMAPADCDARAALAAAVIAAFAGEWAQTALAPPAATASAAAATPAARPWQSELGVLGFAVHDGDELGAGVGIRADLGRGAWLLGALVEATSERTQSLGTGQGGYRFVRGGIGLGVRPRWSRLFGDVTLVPMLDRSWLGGKNLETTYQVSRWGFVLAVQARLGLVLGRLRPFVFAGASYRTPSERMTLVDRSDIKVPLSAVNAEVGFGMAVAIWR